MGRRADEAKSRSRKDYAAAFEARLQWSTQPYGRRSQAQDRPMRKWQRWLDPDRVALDQGGSGQDRPGSGERLAEVLADGDAEVTVQRLKDDVDRLSSS
jgi:hypothetical protein